MTDYVDNLEVLDPFRAQGEIDLAESISLRTPFTTLDPFLWRDKINALYPNTLTHFDVLDDYRLYQLANKSVSNSRIMENGSLRMTADGYARVLESAS